MQDTNTTKLIILRKFEENYKEFSSKILSGPIVIPLKDSGNQKGNMKLKLSFCQLHLGDDNLEGAVKRFFSKIGKNLVETHRDELFGSRYESEVETLDELHFLLYEFEQLEEIDDGYTFVTTSALKENGEKGLWINFDSLWQY